MCLRQDSNLQPDRYERPALTIELRARSLPAFAIDRYGDAGDSAYHLKAGAGRGVQRSMPTG